MATARTTSLRALHQLSAKTRHTRSLHITGPSTYSSPLLTTESPAVNLPIDLAGLVAECRSRELSIKGSKAELVERLTAHELMQTRSLSSLLKQVPKHLAPTTTPDSTSPNTRYFNTSRELKAVGDTSTIDFAYIPDFDPDLENPPRIRVPILPQNYRNPTVPIDADATEAKEAVMRPEIVTASADSTFISAPSHLSDVHDNTTVDIQTMAQQAASAATELGGSSSVDETSGTLKEVWNGFLDDLLGPKQKK